MENEIKTQNGAIHTVSALVANKPGVLARIAQVFARRGFNIESLVVSPSTDGAYSRMTIGASGKEGGLGQILAQVNKLVDVLTCYDHTFDNAVVRELVLVKIGADTEQRTEALQISGHFGCKTVDLTESSMIIMGTGETEKIDSLINMLQKFTLIEMVRTGKVVMVRGEEIT